MNLINWFIDLPLEDKVGVFNYISMKNLTRQEEARYPQKMYAIEDQQTTSIARQVELGIEELRITLGGEKQ